MKPIASKWNHFISKRRHLKRNSYQEIQKGCRMEYPTEPKHQTESIVQGPTEGQTSRLCQTRTLSKTILIKPTDEEVEGKPTAADPKPNEKIVTGKVKKPELMAFKCYFPGARQEKSNQQT